MISKRYDMALKWHEVKVLENKVWDEGLVTIKYDWSPDFEPGQFVTAAHPDDDPPERRLYSIASAPGQLLELYVVMVDDGHLTPRMTTMKPGDKMMFLERIKGLFTVGHVPKKDNLWLLSTGTGLAPYISILREESVWEKFNTVIVAHGARYARQLSYAEELQEISKTRPLKYLPSVTREDAEGITKGRITNLFDDGRLEKEAGVKISKEGSHVMLCGNPAMVQQMMASLETKRDMKLHKRRIAGEITIEKYW